MMLTARQVLSKTVRSSRVLISERRAVAPCALQTSQRCRSLASKAPGSDPLDLLRKECTARSLCDEEGCRLPGTHWIFSLAISPPDASSPPNLRTIGIERVSRAGIDFVLKRGSPTSDSVASGRPVAILHQQGRFLPGESAEQWRGEGRCDELKLGDVLDLIPHHVVTSIVASSRISAEKSAAAGKEGVSVGRLAMLSKSHVTDIMQKTRRELESGDISMEELERCIIAYRFEPERLELMFGGPDSVMWDRWEWLRDTQGDAERGSIAWVDPKHLVPH